MIFVSEENVATEISQASVTYQEIEASTTTSQNFDDRHSVNELPEPSGRPPSSINEEKNDLNVPMPNPMDKSSQTDWDYLTTHDSLTSASLLDFSCNLNADDPSSSPIF